MTWTPRDIPDLTGRRALVTGATDGLGLETALALAAHGATVVLSGRNPAKGASALQRIRGASPGADVSFEPAELSDLSTVRSLAQRVGAAPLDILVNNAGIMGLPERRETVNGFEMQLGVNYVSHFVLTGLLLGALRQSPAPRVVSLSSLASAPGRIRFDDLQLKQGYKPFTAYSQSKLAMLMFALELQRRSDIHGWGLTSAAAHPGFSQTNLSTGMQGEGGAPTLGQRIGEAIGPLFSQSADRGAAPQLLVATAPGVKGGGYWGPNGVLELKGPPVEAKIPARAADVAGAAKLWDATQALTDYPFGEAA